MSHSTTNIQFDTYKGHPVYYVYYGSELLWYRDTIRVNVSEFLVHGSGSTEIFIVTATTSYSISVSDSWIHVSPLGADSGVTAFSVTFDRNELYERFGTIMVGYLEISVKQMPYVAPNEIFYATSQGIARNVFTLTGWGANIVSNTYANGFGKIVFDDTVVSIPEKAFQEYYGDEADYTSIYLPDSLTTIGDYAFRSCGGVNNFYLPSGVTSIGENAFYGCSGITSFEIPEGVTTINQGTFFNCFSLESVTIPSGVSSIGRYAFAITNLKEINLPSALTFIDDYAFQGCSGLTSVVIPEGVTTINEGTFQSCTSLSSVTIPSTVTSLDILVFKDDSALSEIYAHPATAPALEIESFKDIAYGGTLHYPSGSDYSSWMQQIQYRLGIYNWTAIGDL